jgi:hypothetical protein
MLVLATHIIIRGQDSCFQDKAVLTVKVSSADWHLSQVDTKVVLLITALANVFTFFVAGG